MTLQSILANNDQAFENQDVNNDDLEKCLQVRYANLFLFNIFQLPRQFYFFKNHALFCIVNYWHDVNLVLIQQNSR